MKVFLTGGTGYLGGAILAELVAHGHQVLAHARSDTAAAQLASMGIDTVTGDLADTGWLTGRLSGVEGMIHAASPNDATSASVDNAVLDAALPTFAGTDRPYVHTGGAWIHGSGSAITEAAPADPPPVVAWRPGVVDRVRGAADSGVRSCVVAPANLYGNAGGLPALITAGPATGGDNSALLYPGADQRFANVYTGDIAAMFRLALETAPPGRLLPRSQRRRSPNVHGREAGKPSSRPGRPDCPGACRGNPQPARTANRPAAARPAEDHPRAISNRLCVLFNHKLLPRDPRRPQGRAGLVDDPVVRD